MRLKSRLNRLRRSHTRSGSSRGSDESTADHETTTNMRSNICGTVKALGGRKNMGWAWVQAVNEARMSG